MPIWKPAIDIESTLILINKEQLHNRIHRAHDRLIELRVCSIDGSGDQEIETFIALMQSLLDGNVSIIGEGIGE